MRKGVMLPRSLQLSRLTSMLQVKQLQIDGHESKLGSRPQGVFTKAGPSDKIYFGVTGRRELAWTMGLQGA